MLTLFYKVLFMDSQHPPLETLQDIKRMMERSSRFISLSGWSGISAGVCALLGAAVAHIRINSYLLGDYTSESYHRGETYTLNGSGYDLYYDLLLIAGITFLAAFISSFLFTRARSRRNGTSMWDRTVQRLAWNTVLPMMVGGFVILRLLESGF